MKSSVVLSASTVSTAGIQAAAIYPSGKSSAPPTNGETL